MTDPRTQNTLIQIERQLALLAKNTGLLVEAVNKLTRKLPPLEVTTASRQCDYPDPQGVCLGDLQGNEEYCENCTATKEGTA